MNEFSFRGSNSFIFIFASHLIRGQLSMSKFFPLRVDPSLKGLHCPRKHKKSQKLYLFVKMIENHAGAVLEMGSGPVAKCA